jgi:hypothetical protein
MPLEWQAATQALLLAVKHDGPMFARIGVMRALNRHVERVFNSRPERPALGTPEAIARSMATTGKYCGGIDPHRTCSNRGRSFRQ